jgi:hypothetical protein
MLVVVIVTVAVAGIVAGHEVAGGVHAFTQDAASTSSTSATLSNRLISNRVPVSASQQRASHEHRHRCRYHWYTPHTLSTAQRYLRPSIYSCHNT